MPSKGNLARSPSSVQQCCVSCPKEFSTEHFHPPVARAASACSSSHPPTPCQFTYLSCNVSWLAAQLFPRLPEQARSTPILPISTIAALVAHTSMLRHTAGPSLTRTLQAPSPASISTKPRPGSPGTFNHNLDVCAHQALNIDTNTPTPSLVWMRSF